MKLNNNYNHFNKICGDFVEVLQHNHGNKQNCVTVQPMV